MAIYTEAEANAFFTAAKAAYLSALSKKSYQIKDRAKHEQELSVLRNEMNSWANILNSLSASAESAVFRVHS